MKLKNKKTGKIIKLDIHCIDGKVYEFLSEISEEWEDYEEPKEYWFIDAFGNIVQNEITKYYGDEYQKQIGNYFATKEEAEKAVKKLKAWKRLKDKKFKFTEWYKPDGCEPFIVVETNINYDDVDNMELQKDLELLFSGGEE